MYTKGRHPQAHSWPKVEKKSAAEAACCEGATDNYIKFPFKSHQKPTVIPLNPTLLHLIVCPNPSKPQAAARSLEAAGAGRPFADVTTRHGADVGLTGEKSRLTDWIGTN